MSLYTVSSILCGIRYKVEFCKVSALQYVLE